MNDVAFEIARIVFATIGALVGLYLIPYINHKLNDAKYDEVRKIVEVAVRAVEQTIRESGMGKAKKAEVIAFVTAWLKSKNIAITDEQLDKLIECTVYHMKLEQK